MEVKTDLKHEYSEFVTVAEAKAAVEESYKAGFCRSDIVYALLDLAEKLEKENTKK